ncbi:MAG: cytochrome c3 family protein [Bacteroidales bacterium]
MKITWNIKLVVVVFAMIITSCSTEKNYRLLSFFFDGVPSPVNTIQAGDSATGTFDQLTGGPDSAEIRIVPVYIIHAPYEEKDCMNCHDRNSPGEMIEAEPGLCYRCHEDFESKYKVIHGPVAGGYCSECHNPHQGTNRYMLRRTGQPLCTFCHNLDHAPMNDMHVDLGDTECDLCHNPHGGSDINFIRE